MSLLERFEQAFPVVKSRQAQTGTPELERSMRIRAYGSGQVVLLSEFLSLVIKICEDAAGIEDFYGIHQRGN